jgi:hypothetical protein
MAKLIKKTLAGAAVAALSFAAAHADPLSVLRSELAKNPEAGSLVKSFPAASGLTGVVLKTKTGQPMIAYVTPDGRYLIAGAVIDLSNGENITARDATKEIGQAAVPSPEQGQQAVYALGKMQGIIFGNPSSSAYLAVVFDPSTAKGRDLLLMTMNQAVQMHNTGMDATQQIRFYPYGPKAAQLLSGSNVQQLRNLLDFVQGKGLPQATAAAQTFAKRNSEIAAKMPVHPPSMIVFDPQSQFARAISLEKSDPSPTLVQQLNAMQQSLTLSR